jgi:deoxyribose-phosphate aldolase
LYKEINLYDLTKSEKSIIEEAFKAIDQGIDCIFTSSLYAGKLRALLPDFINIACPIDYPNGLGNTSVRQHECVTAINRGVKHIDLVVNPIYITNNEKNKLTDDIRACKAICTSKNVDLRAILDYRMYPDGLVFTMCNLLQNLDIKFVSPSSGQFIEDYLDNIIMCELIQNKNTRLQTIFSAPFCSAEELDKLHKSNIYGIRLKRFGVQ